MKINDIYKLVTSILVKNEIETSYDAYSDRITYIAAIFCCNMAAFDRDIRESHNLPSQSAFNEICLKLDDDFPLCSRFLSAAAYYIASMLISHENESLSEKLYNYFTTEIKAIISETPSQKRKISDAYGFKD